MKKISENYSLIMEDFFDGSKEVFDFGCKDFIPLSGDDCFNATLANIDSITTSFTGPYDICSYLSKSAYFNKEEFGKNIYVQHISRSTGKVNRLPAIWNDETLHEIAISVNGNSVNYDNAKTKETFDRMYEELTSGSSSFRDYVLRYVHDNPSINSYNCNLIREISNTNYDNSGIFKMLPESFSSYREFRSLYVIYNSYISTKEKKDDNSLEKK